MHGDAAGKLDIRIPPTPSAGLAASSSAAAVLLLDSRRLCLGVVVKHSKVIAAITLFVGPTLCSSLFADPFYMGGDVSLLPFIESAGGNFRDGGQVRPLEQIMVNHGDNLFRLRLFVNPN